jgi:hypothetical protein
MEMAVANVFECGDDPWKIVEAAEFKDYDFEGHPNNLVKHDETIHNDKRQHNKMKQTYGKEGRRDRSHLH